MKWPISKRQNYVLAKKKSSGSFVPGEHFSPGAKPPELTELTEQLTKRIRFPFFVHLEIQVHVLRAIKETKAFLMDDHS